MTICALKIDPVLVGNVFSRSNVIVDRMSQYIDILEPSDNNDRKYHLGLGEHYDQT